MLRRTLNAFSMLLAGRGGSVAVMFGFALPAVIAAVGLAIDGSNLMAQRSKLQTVADAAALASAKELRLANATSQSITVVAENFVYANLIIGGVAPPVVIETSVPADKASIRVTLSKSFETYLFKYFGNDANTVRATAQARIVGGNPVCLVALDAKSDNTLVLTQDAILSAPTCEIYSNSKSAKGLTVQMRAQLTAGAVCSAGGKFANQGSIKPNPQLDCPVLNDPLGNRPRPTTPAACDFVNLQVSGGTRTLYPGAYCGGLYVTGGAQVSMNPGEYILNNGPLMVDASSAIKGEGVGFYLTGHNASFYFDGTSTIELSAPLTGALAGILIYQDPAVKIDLPGVPLPSGVKAPVKLPPLPKLGPGIPSFRDPINQILSDNARTLLGTIYLPDGALYIDANRPIADRSAYTIIVAREVGIASGPNLVLNSDYAATTVPVPNGVGLTGGSARLDQ